MRGCVRCGSTCETSVIGNCEVKQLQENIGTDLVKAQQVLVQLKHDTGSLDLVKGFDQRLHTGTVR